MANLPPELWVRIFQFATLPGSWTKATLCTMNSTKFPDILGGEWASAEPYTQYKTKHSLSLVNRAFNHLAQEFLYRILFIPDEDTAEYLANFITSHDREYRLDIRIWVREIVIAPPSRFSSASCHKLAAGVIRILSNLDHLEVFFLRWKSPRACEEQIVDALPPSLKHFEWHNPGGGFSTAPKRSLSLFLHKLRNNVEVLRVSGYLPLPGPSSNADDYSGNECEFPTLKQLSVHREFYCDLHLISTWITSNSLTCLSLGTFWSYPKSRDPQCSFFNTTLPSLRCLHLGKSARLSPALLRTILGSAIHLQALEYTFIGNIDVDIWRDVEHHYVEKIGIRFISPWEFLNLADHLRPFVTNKFSQEGGQSAHFRSLQNLKFAVPGWSGEKQSTVRDIVKLKNLVREVMGPSTSLAVDFEIDVS